MRRTKMVNRGYISLIVLCCIVVHAAVILAAGSVNLELEVPDEYTSVVRGNDIWFTTRIMNLINQDRIDVSLTYQLFDSDQRLITEKTETVAIETQASFVGNMAVPQDIRPGHYTLHAILTLNESTYTAERTVIVTTDDRNFVLIQVLIVAIGVVLLILSLKVVRDIYRKMRLHAQVHHIVKTRSYHKTNNSKIK